MKQITLPPWWPDNPPIYDITKSYAENAAEGPFFEGKLVQRVIPPAEQWIDFLGYKVASPIGVPAGPLLNGKWVVFAAKMGFDIVTYKTIRSKAHPSHPLPNMIYVDTKGALTADRHGESLKPAAFPPRDMEQLALTNSFGIPSKDPEYLMQDIARANEGLHKGQIMIVSVVGTPREGENYRDDFTKAALVAKECGAKIIELDFSCPNISSAEGSLFADPDAVLAICTNVTKAIGSIPLIIKIGVVTNAQLLQKVMTAAAQGGARAICGINTVSMKLVTEEGTPALGTGRVKAGVCGGPIRVMALDFIRKSHKINQQQKLGLTLMATGGVTTPQHFTQFFEAGADVAMSGVGMMWDPYLAARYHEREGRA